MQSNMSTATAQVLDTSELLHEILLSLPPRKIFIVQAVCKKWQKVINESLWIQKTLFRRPWTNSVLEPSQIQTRGGVTVAQYSKGVEINRIVPAQILFQNLRERADSWIGYCFSPVVREHNACASFRDLFWTDPPVTIAYMAVKFFDSKDSTRHCRMVRCSVQHLGGIKLGLLLNVAAQIIDAAEEGEGIQRTEVWAFCDTPLSMESKSLLRVEGMRRREEAEREMHAKKLAEGVKAGNEGVQKSSTENVGVAEDTSSPGKKHN